MLQWAMTGGLLIPYTLAMVSILHALFMQSSDFGELSAGML